MLAMTRSRPPQRRHVSMSMANTRLRRCAHVRARCRSVTEASPYSLGRRRAFWAQPGADPGSPARTHRVSESGARGASARVKSRDKILGLENHVRRTGCSTRSGTPARRRAESAPTRPLRLSGLRVAALPVWGAARTGPDLQRPRQPDLAPIVGRAQAGQPLEEAAEVGWIIVAHHPPDLLDRAVARLEDLLRLLDAKR